MDCCGLWPKANDMTQNTTKPLPLTKRSNLLIVGSGAIGLLWYSHLYLRSQSKVNAFLYQSPQRTSLPDKVTFTDLHNKTHLIPSQIYEPNSISASHNLIANATKAVIHKSGFDIILVCVKSYQLDAAIEEIKPLLSAKTVVITSHNGLGALSKANSELLSHCHLWNLLTTHGCLKSSENTIIHTGEGVSDLGIQLSAPPNQLIQQITALLNNALPKVNWCNQLAEKQWTKLAINCVINPLTALFDIKNGEVAEAKFDHIIDQLLEEIVHVALKNDVKLNKARLKETVINVANKTANNSSSMRCDVQAKRTTEVEYINGYIHHLGAKSAISTKKNTELYQGVLALHLNNVQ